MGDQHTVVVVAMEGFQLLDLAGPVEVLYGANYFAGKDLYRTLVATPGGRDVRSHSGVRMGADVALEEVARSRSHVGTLTVVGGFGTPVAANDDGFIADLLTPGGEASDGDGFDVFDDQPLTADELAEDLPPDAIEKLDRFLAEVSAG